MTTTWHAAAAEFAAATAAFNTRALHRAGLIDTADIDAIHALLTVLENAAETKDQKAIALSIRHLLPKISMPH
jgi:hypothetical protein